MITSPLNGISPYLTTLPALMTGPRSVRLQSVEPWSNIQLCPPPVRGFVGLLCSFTELSGTNREPAVAVKTFGDRASLGPLVDGRHPRQAPDRLLRMGPQTRCLSCGSARLTERPDRTAQGFHRFRWHAKNRSGLHWARQQANAKCEPP